MPANKGSKHHNWLDEKVGYIGLHVYMRGQKTEPDKCPICKLDKELELCNISKTYNPETYNRNPKNWFWACCKCHAEYDRRHEGERNSMYGKHHTPETKIKMGESIRKASKVKPLSFYRDLPGGLAK